MGWEVGAGGSEGKFFHTLELKSSHYAFMEVLKGAQGTCQAEKFVKSSFTPNLALLVRPSGPVCPTVNCHGFKRSQL